MSIFNSKLLVYQRVCTFHGVKFPVVSMTSRKARTASRVMEGSSPSRTCPIYDICNTYTQIYIYNIHTYVYIFIYDKCISYCLPRTSISAKWSPFSWNYVMFFVPFPEQTRHFLKLLLFHKLQVYQHCLKQLIYCSPPCQQLQPQVQKPVWFAVCIYQ